jgi:hypothetical protein
MDGMDARFLETTKHGLGLYERVKGETTERRNLAEVATDSL